MSPIFPCNPTFINTILLGGAPEQKIEAARSAGFDQIEIWRQDVEAHEGGPEDLSGCLHKHGIGVTDYEVVRDFDGAPEILREKKRAEALSMLDTAVSIGTNTVLVTASSDPDCIADRIDEDLRWLTREAALRRLRIAYEGLAWSAVNFTLTSAWECVKRINEPNLGIVIDPFHLFVRAGDASDLDDIPMDRIFLIQLSDSSLDSCTNLQLVIDTARHSRLLPGQGRFPIHTIVERLKERGYAGPIGIEVFNDEMKAQDPQMVAREAMLALNRVWSK
jgi:4-hydroxyphenylpyruvate dioxygenase